MNIMLNGRPPHIFVSPNLVFFAKSLDTPELDPLQITILKIPLRDIMIS